MSANSIGRPPDIASALDLERLREWMASSVDGWTDEPISATLASGGRSNLTFIVSQGPQSCVLRRPPLGQLLPSAHDMKREFRVISALAETAVPVPASFGLCSDLSVLGTTFYVMEFVAGRTFAKASETAELSDPEAAELSRNYVEVLASIHKVDFEAIGLGNFGRPVGYIDRQVSRWVDQWDKSHTREIPQMASLVEQLRSRVPKESRSSLVHGDYRLDNLLIARAPDLDVLAVVDWEMSTLGDPLADVGLMMVYWSEPQDGFIPTSVASQISGNSGFWTRSQLVELYASLTDTDVSQLPFYMALGYFKLAVIFEGIHLRHKMGQTLGGGFDGIGDEVPILIDHALESLTATI